MPQYPKISIIIPSFNQGAFIEKTIFSVINQNYPNLEFIIMDGGSRDNTVDIIKKYEDKITYWVSEKDEGQSDAINKGIAKATGDVFNWLNSDDYLEPGSLEEVANFFRNPELQLLIGGCRFFHNATGETDEIVFPEPKNSIEQNLCHTTLVQPSMFYKMSIVKELGGVEKHFPYAMDRDLWFQFLTKYGINHIGYSSKILSHFRFHEQSKTVAEEKRFAEDKYVILHSLLQQAGAPQFMLDYCLRFKLNKKYERQWDLSKLNKKLLIAFYAERFCYKYLTIGDYENGRKCLNLAREYGYPGDLRFYWHLLKLNIFKGNLSKLKKNIIPRDENVVKET